MSRSDSGNFSIFLLVKLFYKIQNLGKKNFFFGRLELITLPVFV